MKKLSKEEQVDLIRRMRDNDSEAKDMFVTQYQSLVFDHAFKYLSVIETKSRGLYELKDICQEIWLHIFSSIHSYDPEKSSLTTWLYKVCPSACQRLLIKIQRKKNMPTNEDDEMEYVISLDISYQDNDLMLIDTIIDPLGSFENRIIQEFEIYDIIYSVAQYIDTLSHTGQIIYLHQIKGLTLAQSAIVIGCTRQNIDRISKKIEKQLINFFQYKVYKKNDHKESYEFAMKLLSRDSDDDVANNSIFSLASVKACRELLFLTGLYATKELFSISKE